MSASMRDFIKIAAIVVVTLSLVSLIFVGLNKATGFADKMFAKMDTMSTTLEESDYTKYDGTICTGADVIAAVKYLQNGEPICITVATVGGDVVFGYTDSSLSTKVSSDANASNLANCQRKGSSTYINPNAKYLGKVERNETDNSIWGITFTFYTA